MERVTRNVGRARRGGLRTAVTAGVVGVGLVAGGCNNAVEGGLSGAAMGSLVGLGIGSLSGDAGTGAAIGALAGAGAGAVIGDQNERRDRRYDDRRDDW